MMTKSGISNVVLGVHCTLLSITVLWLLSSIGQAAYTAFVSQDVTLSALFTSGATWAIILWSVATVATTINIVAGVKRRNLRHLSYVTAIWVLVVVNISITHLGGPLGNRAITTGTSVSVAIAVLAAYMLYKLEMQVVRRKGRDADGKSKRSPTHVV
jgi:hypothetical protein